MSRPETADAAPRSGLLTSGLLVATGTLTVAWQLFLLVRTAAAALLDAQSAPPILSPGLWLAILRRFGDRHDLTTGRWEVSFPRMLIGVGILASLSWVFGAMLIAKRRGWSFQGAAIAWGRQGWIWWLLPLAGEALLILGDLLGLPVIAAVLNGTLSLWWSVLLAGWLATGWSLAISSENEVPVKNSLTDNFRVPLTVWFAFAAYSVCYTILNWQLYRAMLVPHGDSAMYEEHLWNLLHGKGFRSYLDNGRLFLGEHIQVIHLLLIPLYLVWPSHLLLEMSQSIALASAAIPIYWIARRHSGSTKAGVLLACAYLLYFPMQFLDISIDFKTFRPNAFEIPLLLFGLDALERCRFRTFLVYLFVMLICQEDAAMIIGPLGAWIALRQPKLTPANHPWRARVRWLGWGLAVFGVVYVIFVIKVALPYFRNWQDVHFASYFSQFGNSTGEIVRTVLTKPHLLLREWLGGDVWVYFLALVVPLAALCFLSPGRAFVAAPLFGILCLNTLARTPLHHFHAPLIPVLFWAAAAGLANVPRMSTWFSGLTTRLFYRDRKPQSENKSSPPRLTRDRCVPTGRALPNRDPSVKKDSQAKPSTSTAETVVLLRQPAEAAPAINRAARIAFLCSLISGISFSLGPLGVTFWDPHSPGYWRKKYIPDERVEQFAKIAPLIPQSSRVASTDFVHPRFTHHERSYDYSDYRPVVPDDADFIVIDTHGPYSKLRKPEQVKEYRDHPDQWELLPDHTGGYFIVLRRIRK